MDSYYIYIDESGSSDPKSFPSSPYFTLCGLLINEKNREKLRTDLKKLKKKYFSDENYVLHASDLKFHLKSRNKDLKNFAKDLKIVLNGTFFTLMYVTVDKKSAYASGWDVVHVYKQTFTILLANMLKFLVAKNLKGQIFAEASNANQDIHLYQAFFHLIRRGINWVSITNKSARLHFTSLCFVTKLNNDSEEQLCDLFGVYGRLEREIKLKKRILSDLNPFERVIFDCAGKKLFKGNAAKAQRKSELYHAINSLKIIP